MKINKINNYYSVSEQITVDDIQKIKDNGFKTIICNRPDNESTDQPKHSEIMEVAKSLDVNFYFIPIIPGQFTKENIEDFKKIESDKQNQPMFAFCRTGTRSCMLWALTHMNDIPKEEILETCHKAGYDLSQLFS